jgi:FeS assembly protein IscX
MRWNEIEKIAEALEDSHSDQDISRVKLSRLHKWIVHLLDFDDNPSYFSERILETIQGQWRSIRGEDEE